MSIPNSSADTAYAKTSPRQKLAYKSAVDDTANAVSQKCDTSARAAGKLEMKQVFRKDAPVTFDPDTVIRHCNASQPKSSESQMREPARAGAMRAFEIPSVGLGC